MDFIASLFDSNKRDLARLRKTVVQINALEPQVQAQTDSQLRDRLDELRTEVRGAIERARELFLRSIELNPANWSAMWFIGKIYQRLDDNGSALSWFERASDVNGSQPDIAREHSGCDGSASTRASGRLH